MLEKLMPRTRIAALGLLLGNPLHQYYLREIARACGIPLRAAQRELALYEELGLVSRVPRGRQVFFRVHTGHPLFAELRALVAKAGAPGGPPHAPATLPVGRAEGTPAPVKSEREGFAPPRGDQSWRVW